MSEKLDVLIITQFFPPESMGGAHRWEKLAKNLDDDIKPHVLTTQPTFPFGEFERRWKVSSRESMNGIPVTRLFTYQPTRDFVMARILNYGVFSFLSSLYVLLTFWRYDCIVTMSAPHTTFLPGLIGRLTGRIWVIDIFDIWLDNAADLGYIDENSIVFRMMESLERISFRMADKGFVITDTMREFYESKFPETDIDLQVIPFGIDIEQFASEVNENESTDIIYTGNIGSGQAFIPFLEGFGALPEDPELTIVGDGERRHEIESYVEQLGVAEQVSFEGYVDRSEIPGLLAGASVSLVPLKTDHNLDYAQPTKLLETMAVGTPYVASAVAEIEDLTEKWNTGFAVNNDPEEISEALQDTLTNRKLRGEMGKRGQEFVQENHDWGKIGAEVSRAISKLAE